MIVFSLALATQAVADDSSGLRLKPKTIGPGPSAGSVIAGVTAPYRAEASPAENPTSILPQPGLDREQIPNSCAVPGATLCYDYQTGRPVYKPARELMPEIAGMRRENITIKRDKITMSYSFK